MSYSKNNILVIAPHHDDEAFGCGGFIKKNVDNGSIVTILFITAGWSGVRNKNMTKEEKVQLRESEAMNAWNILGTNRILFLRKEDRSLYADQTLLPDLVETIQTVQPNILLTPHKNDADFEHKLIHVLTKEAAWLAKEGALFSDLPQAQGLEKILFYEVWTPIVKPTLYIDISEQIDWKKRMMAEYKSQLQQRGYANATVGLNMFRGGLKGIQYAEAFQEKSV